MDNHCCYGEEEMIRFFPCYWGLVNGGGHYMSLWDAEDPFWKPSPGIQMLCGLSGTLALW